MYFTLMGKLSARRQNLTEDKDKGFTLIELLVVVIIIGILAAIAIPVYLGVQNNAKDSGVKSDVTNVKTAIISVQTNTGTLPAAAAYSATSALTADLKAAGASMGSDTSAIAYQVTADKKGFCIQGTSSTGNTFASSENSGVAAGTCKDGAFVAK
ncbi:type II secretion system protein [Frigoribacterium sp. NPDC087798]|jgi:prepilin-type N-terminal cleavage/methylation domain-containing protein|uniref:type II secretion system protein n=1 Tax=Frigoribacterium sp. NPDC087798 TaxID=3363993 RepID=UPI0037F26DEB